MYPNQSEADVFWTTRIVWSFLPVLLCGFAVVVWYGMHVMKGVIDFIPKIRVTVVTILYIIWPGLCSQTFLMFACRSLCDREVLRIDLEERCWEGRHATFIILLGIPTFLVYVLGCPIVVLIITKRCVVCVFF